jgi:hypothetical protein
MAKFYTVETQLMGDVPPRAPGNEALGGRKRLYRATIDLDAPKLSTTQNGTVITTADTVLLARIPAGMRFAQGRITSSVSLGTATVAIGTAAAPGKYRAAAVHTAVDTPTSFGVTAAMAAPALGADEEVILTVATANLPNTAGADLVIDLEFVGP